ncbi:MAG TPA: GFA family protein, partial [Candidatus Binatus sp.]|nr:GFA family protein [Candidatus Binatus sp.]
MNALCHCDSCKRRTGSAFGWSAYFADAQVLRTIGDLKIYAISTPAPAQRSFCTNCGSTLFWKADIMPGYVGIAAGCFDET